MKNTKKYGYIFLFLFVFFMIYNLFYYFILFGILMIKDSIDGIIFYINLNKKGITSFGKIISYEYDDGYKIPIIEFETQDSKTISKKPFFYESSDIDKFISVKNNINKNVKIVFEEKNPENFVIKVDKEFSYGTLILMIIIGLVFIFFGIYKLFKI